MGPIAKAVKHATQQEQNNWEWRYYLSIQDAPRKDDSRSDAAAMNRMEWLRAEMTPAERIIWTATWSTM